jgi:hypothetical protein
MAGSTCPNCGDEGSGTFYELTGVPVHSVLLLSNHHDAVDFPTGDIVLAHCEECDFVFNAAFDPALLRYGAGYDPTQAFSPTFNRFHQQLAERLVARHDLRHKDIVEIGCGGGEFLTLLCDLGSNRGHGFDPACEPTRRGGATFVADFYSEAYAHVPADFLCCKMTLEHIPHTARFVEMVRRCIGSRPDTTVFFMVPDATRILSELAYWDIYYEHCSYFSLRSLGHLFRRNGFEIVDAQTEYAGQYLTIEARPGIGGVSAGDPLAIAFFAEHVPPRINAARRAIDDMHKAGRRLVLWGGGSKAVAFLTTLGIGDEVSQVVDVNPHKHGTWLPGTGHPVIGPDALRGQPPDVVIVMNPAYNEEIRRTLGDMGMKPDLVPIDGIGDRRE